MSAMTDYEEVQQRAAMFRTSTFTQRANSTAYALGDRVYAATFDGNFYECIAAGTSGGAPPTFNTNLGDTTTDGTVTWLTLKPAAPKRPMWVALYTAMPGETGGGTEVSVGGYLRVQRDPSDANWTAASATDGRTDNAAAIAFPTPTANWGVVAGFGFHDRPTAGNLRIYGALTDPKTINLGDPAPSFPAGELAVIFA